jgi:hypothetical protein
LIYDLVIFISDLHIPFEHPDALKFLAAIKKKYWKKAKKPLVVNLGDELTWSAISYHEQNPLLPNASLELEMSLSPIQNLHKLFPKMKIMESNHGSLVYRKQKSAGLPAAVFKHYNEILGIPRNDWQWVKDLTIKVSGPKTVYICHGRSADITKLAQLNGFCSVAGHFHEKMKIEYFANTVGVNWGMQCGCLIDNNSPEFDYNKLNLKSPMIGTGIIVNGDPKLYRMELNNLGRWTGRLV